MVAASTVGFGGDGVEFSAADQRRDDAGTGWLLDKPAEETPERRFLPSGGNQHRKQLGTKPGPICCPNQSIIAVTPGRCWQARAAALERVRQALQVAGRKRKKAMSYARRRSRLGRAPWKQKRAHARSLYP